MSFDNYVMTYPTNIVLSVTVVVNNCIIPNDTYQLYITIDNSFTIYGALHSTAALYTLQCVATDGDSGYTLISLLKIERLFL